MSALGALVMALGLLGGGGSDERAKLLAALGEPDAARRQQVVAELDRLGALDDPAVLHALQRTQDAAELKLATIAGLQGSGAAGASGLLARWIADDEARVREAAAQALLQHLTRRRPAPQLVHEPVACVRVGKAARLQATVPGAEHLAARVVVDSSSYAWLQSQGDQLQGALPARAEPGTFTYVVEVLQFRPEAAAKLPAELRDRLLQVNRRVGTPDATVTVVPKGGTCPGREAEEGTALTFTPLEPRPR